MLRFFLPKESRGKILFLHFLLENGTRPTIGRQSIDGILQSILHLLELLHILFIIGNIAQLRMNTGIKLQTEIFVTEHRYTLKSVSIEGKQLFSDIFRVIVTFLPAFFQQAKRIFRFTETETSFQNVLFSIFLKMNIPAELSASERHKMLPLILRNVLLPFSGKTIEHDEEKMKERSLPFSIFPKKGIQGRRKVKVFLLPLSKCCDMTRPDNHNSSPCNNPIPRRTIFSFSSSVKFSLPMTRRRNSPFRLFSSRYSSCRRTSLHSSLIST